jgi:hypothetical protein
MMTAQPEAPLREIANLMEKHSIMRVPIVRDELVVGIVSRANLLQLLARANDNTDWFESDRVLHQRLVDSIKDSHGRTDRSITARLGHTWAERIAAAALRHAARSLLGSALMERA